MKKRLFISMHYMEIGGAEISLIGLLQAIDYSQYDVDLFMYAHRGELMQFIPKEVNLLPEVKEYAHLECPMLQALLDGCWKILYGRLKAKWLFSKYKRSKGIAESAAIMQYVADGVSNFLPSLYQFGKYDLAISYLTPHNYVIDKVLAKKKICWIHTDYSSININVKQEYPIWASYDNIISISSDVSKTFLQVFPSLKEKIVEVANIISPVFVNQRAEEFDATNELAKYGDGIRLLSVGRFCEAKNYDNVPDICRRIISHLSALNSQLKVKWFLIGYGGYENLIRQRIEEMGMQEYVIIIGKRLNPYPYIKACDVYVQPSRYEGKSVTVREAQILCKPVVVTNYTTAPSQICDGIDGCIVPMDNDGCAKGLADFVLNTKLQHRIINNLRSCNYNNKVEMDKLYALI